VLASLALRCSGADASAIAARRLLRLLAPALAVVPSGTLSLGSKLQQGGFSEVYSGKVRARSMSMSMSMSMSIQT
jgi:hypothetical protein